MHGLFSYDADKVVSFRIDNCSFVAYAINEQFIHGKEGDFEYAN